MAFKFRLQKRDDPSPRPPTYSDPGIPRQSMSQREGKGRPFSPHLEVTEVIYDYDRIENIDGEEVRIYVERVSPLS